MRIIKDDWIFGFSKILPVSGAQGYVTKYVLKFDKREFLVPGFSLISHGLGIDYLSDSVKTFHRKNLLSYAVKPGGFKISLPRYYKDKIFSDSQKLIMRKRSEEYRRLLDVKLLSRIDAQMSIGLNPFKKMFNNYEHRLYRSLLLYRSKRKL